MIVQISRSAVSAQAMPNHQPMKQKYSARIRNESCCLCCTTVMFGGGGYIGCGYCGYGAYGGGSWVGCPGGLFCIVFPFHATKIRMCITIAQKSNSAKHNYG